MTDFQFRLAASARAKVCGVVIVDSLAHELVGRVGVLELVKA
jgi:hypothetical protein